MKRYIYGLFAEKIFILYLKFKHSDEDNIGPMSI